MNSFNVNASALNISFVCEITDEQVSIYFDKMPEPNWQADSINASENSDEDEFDADNGRKYKVVAYKNTVEGNVEVFDVTDDEFEVEDFEIEEEFDDDDVPSDL